MSNYTTGEMAKLCNVSVRTVQFYDTKGMTASGYFFWQVGKFGDNVRNKRYGGL